MSTPDTSSANIFYLTGFQRSGTTLCCQLLDRHPEILCAEEPELVKRILYRQFEELQDPEYDAQRDNIRYYGIPPEKYLNLADQFIAEKLSPEEFISQCYSLFNTKNASVIGAKEVLEMLSPKYGFTEYLLSLHSPETKFIFIERDIRGVLASFIKLGFFTPGKKSLTYFNFKRFAKQYLAIINHAKELISQRNSLFVSFETLVTSPEETMKTLFSFLDVDTSEELIKTVLTEKRAGVRYPFTGVKKEPLRDWENILTEKQIKYLEKITR